ncbi:unnamed protein product [Closterium sp. NIES-65]|nr:unnamed protein product [Closterium sp. NIES-65]
MLRSSTTLQTDTVNRFFLRVSSSNSSSGSVRMVWVHLASPATFSAAATAASTSHLLFARDAYLVVAAASNATSLRHPMKRPRDDCAGLGADQPLLGGRESPLMRGGVMRGGMERGGMERGGMERGGMERGGMERGGMERGGMACRGVVCSTQSRRQSVAEQFQQQGESSRAHAADEALLEALLQEGLRQQQQQGGARSRVQWVLWPRVGSESALPDDVLLGFSSEDAALTKRAALSAPPPIHPRAVLPAPMPSELAAPPSSALCFQNPIACCGDFAPCFGDFLLQLVDWPRVGSESALPDDVLLGLCCEGPAFSQCSAPSAPPPTPLPAPVPSVLAAPRGCALGSDCATRELECLDACIDMLANGNNTNGNSNDNDNGNDSNGNSDVALFLDTPVAHMLLGGSTLTIHCGSGPQQQALAASGVAGADLPEWTLEQGGD